MTALCISVGAVIVIDAIANVALGRLLVKQATLLTQACQTLNAAINCVATLAERLGVIDAKEIK